MRPQSIIYFERIILCTLILGLIQSYLAWDQSIAMASAMKGNPVTFVLTVQIFTFAVIVALTLLISRRRSKIAMWVSVALFALGLPAFLWTLVGGQLGGSGIIAVLQMLGQLVAYGLLFTRFSRQWMNHGTQTQ